MQRYCVRMIFDRSLAVGLAFCAALTCGGCNSAESETPNTDAAIDQDADAVLGAVTTSDRQAAADSLASRGAAAEHAVTRVLGETDDEQVKLRMIDSLVEIRGFEGVPQIIDTLADESPAVRRHADEALQDLLCIRVRYDAEASPEERAVAAERYRSYWNSVVEQDLVEVVKHPEQAQDIFRQRVHVIRREKK